MTPRRSEVARPLLEPFAELYELAPGTVLVMDDRRGVRLDSDAISGMLLALDGATPEFALRDRYGAEKFEQLLSVLDNYGLLANDRLSHPVGDLTGTLRTRPASASPAVRRLAEMVDGELRDRGPVVVVTDGYLRPDLAREAKLAEERAEPWLLVKADVDSVWVSSVFAPRHAPCWRCFQRRVLSQDDRLALIHAHGCPQLTPRYGSHVPDPVSQAMAARIAGHIEAQTIAWSGGGPQRLLQVRARDAACAHTVFSYPDCLRCDCSPVARQPADGDLRSRVQSLLGERVGPVTGMVTDRGPCGTVGPVRVAVASFAAPSPIGFCQLALDTSTGALTALSDRARYAFGAGENDSDARARAILEAAERYSMLMHGGEAEVRAARAHLDGLVHGPNDLMLFSDDQLDGKGPPGPAGDLRVPGRYRDDDLLDWCTAVSLTGEPHRVPAACCYRYPDDHPDAATCVYDATGSAVGFSYEAALVSGFLEAVERDAVAIWWYGRIMRPVVDVGSFADTGADSLLAALRARGHRVTLVDVTCDSGVPVLVAMSVGPARDFPIFGFGAHFDVRRALGAALRELGQAVCFQDQERLKWRGFSWERQTHLTTPVDEARHLGDYPKFDREPTTRDCLTAAEAAGTEVLVRDCTRRDLGISCIKVILPGFRGLQPRFAPGRIFDVPARMGWLAEPRSVSDLNTESLRS